MIPALVLTAGVATRLRPLSLVRAKAVLPVAGEPLVTRILQWLRAAGVTDVVLNLHHLPHTVTSRIGDGTEIGLRVRYSWEIPLLGSAGGPRRAIPLLGSSSFLVANGDTLTSAGIAGAVDHHRRSGALITMVVVPNTEPHKYGGVIVDDAGRVTGFVGRGASRPSDHFIGLQVVEAEAFASVPEATPYESVGTLYPHLIQSRPGSVAAYRTSAAFSDIGTPADYLDTSVRLAGGEASRLQGERTRVDASAVVEDSVLWDDVAVDAGATLRGCIVCDGAHIPAGTSWEDVAIRVASDPLTPGERHEGDLAIAGIPRPT